MSLNYRIHWVDDTPENAESILEDVRLDFDEEHIKIVPKIVDDGDDIEEIARSTPLDLFILDYGLDGRNGDKLIKNLRANGELTEIVFYSQNEEIHKICPDTFGVHPCLRDEAGTKIKEVISKFIDRINNIAVVRGMIITEAIEVENRLTEILLDAFGDKKSLFREKILNKPIMDFARKLMFVQSVLNDKISEANQAEPKNDALIEKLKSLKETLKSMQKEIVDQRNILAHSEKGFNEDGILTLKNLHNGPDISFDDDWKNSIRDNVKKHMQNLHEIRESLQHNIA